MGAYYVNLAGYFISVSTFDGRQMLQFTADSDNEQRATALPAGVYILICNEVCGEGVSRNCKIKRGCQNGSLFFYFIRRGRNSVCQYTLYMVFYGLLNSGIFVKFLSKKNGNRCKQ
ncbi:hypothetical protein Barb6XT_01652 [Bacteroidales bacterium Barb6XT]|nr:hypothetical protein Barb6XT_01652 [Bacteroidales bacterium Barb6XT]